MVTEQGPVLAVAGLSLSFQGVAALTDVSFQVAPGEICALIGPNGAGKSSLLNVLNGVYAPDRGEIAFAGRRMTRIDPGWAAANGMGRTFQNNALFGHLSVIDNVLSGLSRLGRAGAFAHALALPRARREEAGFRDRAEAVLDFLDLRPWRDAAVATLPYGVQKRVELGRALAARPRLLLLDEPMAGMNGAEKAVMAELVAAINRDLGVTVVLIEHDVGVVMALCGHVVVLDYGRKVGDGSPAEIRVNPRVIEAYLGAAATSESRDQGLPPS